MFREPQQSIEDDFILAQFQGDRENGLDWSTPMQYVINTHAVIWFLEGNSRLVAIKK